jgi:hypothetical protein
MKSFFTLAVLFSISFVAEAQINSNSTTGEKSSYQIIERGPNHRIWRRVTLQTNELGRVRAVTNSYTELETGMHYKREGQWVESEAKVELTPTGASASKGRHKVNFAANINTVGAIDLTTPDGKRLRSHVLGLSYFDTVTGKSALIAEVKDSIGILSPPNIVIYPDAFTDFKADLRFTYTKAGFEQDVVFKNNPPSPEEYGLDPKTTRLQVLTEFLNPPVPQKQQEVVRGMRVDRVLDFGEMKIKIGKAFLTENEGKKPERVKVDKTWTKLDGRDFLIEDLDYTTIEKQLKTLPGAEQASIKRAKTKGQIASNKRRLPEKKVALVSKKETMQIASLDAMEKGFVMDYAIVTSQADFTFKGDTTYSITNFVSLSGTTVIEGGAVVKFDSGTGVALYFDGVDCRTAPYRPAIFTVKDDDSVGEIIAGSSGNPTTQFVYGLDLATSNLKNLRFCYLDTALVIEQGCTLNVSDCQFVWCNYPINAYESAEINLRNVLICYGTSVVTVGPAIVNG